MYTSEVVSKDVSILFIYLFFVNVMVWWVLGEKE